MADPQQNDDAVRQQKLEECAALHRAALDVVATLLVAQFPALIAVSDFATFVASCLPN
jgi:hypothetical protein